MKRLRLIILAIVCLLMPGNIHASTVVLGDPQNWGTGWPFTLYYGSGGGTRYQQVYDEEEFPSSPMEITDISFFPREGAKWREGTYKLYLSVTSKSVNGLDTSNLDNNVGVNEQLFTSVSLSGLIGSPKYTFTGNSPYTYDPSVGNLLLDIRISNIGVNGAGAFDGRTWDSDGEFSVAHNFGGTLFNNRGLVTEFQYNSVPVPGAIWLLGSGIIGLVAFRRRKS